MHLFSVLWFGLWFILFWDVVWLTGGEGFSTRIVKVAVKVLLFSCCFLYFRSPDLFCIHRVTGRISYFQAFPHSERCPSCTQAVWLCAFLPNTLYRVSICQHRQKDDTSITQCKSMSGRTSCHPARV